MNKVIVFSRFKSLLLLLLVISSFGVNFVDSFGANTLENNNNMYTDNNDKNQDKYHILYVKYRVMYSQTKQGIEVMPYEVMSYIDYLIKLLILLGCCDIDSALMDKKPFYIPWYVRFHTFNNAFCRGILSTRCLFNDAFKLHVFGCKWYFGISNIPYVGGIGNIALVCKPDFILIHCPKFIQERVSIHILEFKPIMFLLERIHQLPKDTNNIVIDSDGQKHDHISFFQSPNLNLYPSSYLGLLVLQFKICDYYDISLNCLGFVVNYLINYLFNKNTKNIILPKTNNKADIESIDKLK